VVQFKISATEASVLGLARIFSNETTNTKVTRERWLSNHHHTNYLIVLSESLEQHDVTIVVWQQQWDYRKDLDQG